MSSRSNGLDSDENDKPLPRPAIPEFPVDVLPLAARNYAKASSLPAALLAGSALGILAGAIGGEAELLGMTDDRNRAIVWVALLAETGAGKSPSLTKLARPLRDLKDASYEEYLQKFKFWKALSKDDQKLQERPTWQTFIRGYSTIEALYRTLRVRPDVLLLFDELKAFLGSLGRYRGDQRSSGDTGGDAPYFMEFWTGVAQPFTRVGGSKDDHNEVDINVPRPTVSIVGPMTLADQHLLGAEADGFRARWLPHPAEPRRSGKIFNPSAEIYQAWAELVERLYKRRHMRRIWKPDADAERRMQAYLAECERRAASPETSMTQTAAYAKAGVYLERLSLILAEADWDGTLPEQDATPPLLHFGVRIVERAARWLNFVYDAWAAIGDRDTVAFNVQDRLADIVVDRLERWIEQHGKHDERGWWVERSELVRRRVAGVRTSHDWRLVLQRYEERNPGCLVKVRGSKAVKVYAPPRLSRPEQYGPHRENPSNTVHSGAVESGPHWSPWVDRIAPAKQNGPLENDAAGGADTARAARFASQNGQIPPSDDPGVKV